MKLQDNNSSGESSSSHTQAYLPSPREVRSDGKFHRPWLLQSIGCCILGLAHTVVERAAYLPFPFGAIIEHVEDTINPWLHPFISALEGQSLHFLAFVDDQICAVGSAVKRHSPISPGAVVEVQKLREMLEQALFTLPGALKRRGFIGFCADSWVSYEVVVREHAQKASTLTSKIPLLNFVIPAFCVIIAPVAGTISAWLVKHSELEAESIQLQDKESPPDVGEESSACASEHLSETSVASANASWSNFKQKEEPIEEFIQMAEEQGKIRFLDSQEQNPLVELFDSSWLMGSSAVPPRKHPSRSSRFKNDND